MSLKFNNLIIFCIAKKLLNISSISSKTLVSSRLITGAGRREHITPVLRQLHWLPVRQRIDFEVMVQVLVYKSFHRLAPPYLSDDCQLVTDVGRRHLRSADVHTCTVPRTQSRLGDRNFGVAAPRLWNNLPVELRQQDICLTEFRRLLKTVLFR